MALEVGAQPLPLAPSGLLTSGWQGERAGDVWVLKACVRAASPRLCARRKYQGVLFSSIDGSRRNSVLFKK